MKLSDPYQCTMYFGCANGRQEEIDVDFGYYGSDHQCVLPQSSKVMVCATDGGADQ